jgi:hypothetical protein
VVFLSLARYTFFVYTDIGLHPAFSLKHSPFTAKMPKALILIADGSEEIEFVTPYDGECRVTIM